MSRHSTARLWSFGLLGAAAATAGAWLYRHRPLDRIPSPEGIENPEVARGFAWVAHLPPLRLMRHMVADQATHLVSKGKAVDLGCGPGYLVLDIARRAPGLHVTGLDLSAEMLAQGRENAQRAGLNDRVSFRCGDAGSLPFADSSLDLVVSTLSLHHWGNPVAVLNEVARVLRPGGSFLIFDLRRDMSAPLWLLVWLVTHAVVPPAQRRAGEPLASRNAAYSYAEAAHLAEYSHLVDWIVRASPLWLIIEGTIAETRLNA